MTPLDFLYGKSRKFTVSQSILRSFGALAGICAFGLLASTEAQTASLTEIALTSLAATTPGHEFPKELLLRATLTGSLPESAAVYHLRYLKDRSINQYRATRDGKRPFAVIYKYNAEGNVQWVHLPRRGGLALQGRISLYQARGRLGFLHVDSGFLSEIDGDGKVVWTSDKLSRFITAESAWKKQADAPRLGPAIASDGQRIFFTLRRKRWIRRSLLRSPGDPVEVDLLMAIDRETGKVSTWMDPTDYSTAWYSQEPNRPAVGRVGFGRIHCIEGRRVCTLSRSSAPKLRESMAEIRYERGVFGRNRLLFDWALRDENVREGVFHPDLGNFALIRLGKSGGTTGGTKIPETREKPADPPRAERSILLRASRDGIVQRYSLGATSPGDLALSQGSGATLRWLSWTQKPANSDPKEHGRTSFVVFDPRSNQIAGNLTTQVPGIDFATVRRRWRPQSLLVVGL